MEGFRTEYGIQEIEDVAPFSLKELNDHGCIDHPCTTCGGLSLESVFKRKIQEFRFCNPMLKNIPDQEIFEEALCKMDMHKVKKYSRRVRGGFWGGWIPFWVKAIRNLRRNDQSTPKWMIYLRERQYLEYDLDFKKIYGYWLKYRLDELELVDFMIYYDKFVPENRKNYLMNIGKSLLKQNYNPSLEETISYRMGLV